MKVTRFAAVFGFLLVSALALPIESDENCLSQVEADTLVSRYAAVIAQKPSDLGSPSKTARLITQPGYSETSDSADILLAIPLGSPTTPSQKAFIANSQKAAPVDQKTIAIYVANCRNVVWRWISTDFGDAKYQVKGIHVFEVASDGKLAATYFEFNSVAGALDTGYKVTTPNGTALVA